MTDVDPYRPPGVGIRRPDGADEELALFGLPAIALATAIGSVFAGTVLIALNYTAQKRRGLGWVVALLFGPLLTTVALSALLIGSRILHIAPMTLLVGVWLAQPPVMTALAALLQGAAIKQRRRAGRRMAPNALAFVIAMVLLPVLALFAAPASAILAGVISRALTD
ncbi:hypothetical protein [Lysobacter sp. CA199]|uniref:hypothetical protein n=1 Tax=Lysobacter sp. CA199 TaxID=3455608 RepID=UPI003F8D7EA3